MDLELLFQLLNLGLNIASQHVPGGKVKEGLDIAQALETIAKNANTLLDQHRGQPIDPTRVKPETLV